MTEVLTQITTPDIPVTPERREIIGEKITIRCEDGEQKYNLQGRIVKPQEGNNNGNCILLLHGSGNGFNPILCFEYEMLRLQDAGFTALAINTRGVGKEPLQPGQTLDLSEKSDGVFAKQTLESRMTDIKQMIDHAKSLGYSLSNIGVVAGSMNAHPFVELLKRDPQYREIGSVALLEGAAYPDNAFDKVFDKTVPPEEQFTTAIKDISEEQIDDFHVYEGIEYETGYQGPVCVVNGGADTLVTEAFRRRYEEAAKDKRRRIGRTRVIPGIGHRLLADVYEQQTFRIQAKNELIRLYGVNTETQRESINASIDQQLTKLHNADQTTDALIQAYSFINEFFNDSLLSVA